MLEKIVNKLWKGIKLAVGGAIVAGVTALNSSKAEASIVENLNVQENIVYDYRGSGDITGIGFSTEDMAQSFIAPAPYFIDAALMLGRYSGEGYSLQILGDNNGFPDENNILASTIENFPMTRDLQFHYMKDFGLTNYAPLNVGERYWIVFNVSPEGGIFGAGYYEGIYFGTDPIPNSEWARKEGEWTLRPLGDMAFYAEFSNIHEPPLLTLLGIGGLAGLALSRSYKRNKN